MGFVKHVAVATEAPEMLRSSHTGTGVPQGRVRLPVASCFEVICVVTQSGQACVSIFQSVLALCVCTLCVQTCVCTHRERMHMCIVQSMLAFVRACHDIDSAVRFECCVHTCESAYVCACVRVYKRVCVCTCRERMSVCICM